MSWLTCLKPIVCYEQDMQIGFTEIKINIMRNALVLINAAMLVLVCHASLAQSALRMKAENPITSLAQSQLQDPKQFLSTLGCGNFGNETLAINDEEKIPEEVKRKFTSLFKAVQSINIDETFSHYDKSCRFLENGVLFDFDTYKKAVGNNFASTKEFRFNGKETYTVIDEKGVTVDWVGALVVVTKDGESLYFDHYAVSMCFKNVKNEWRIIHNHESFVARK
jgi:hypothetical protein